MLVKEFHGFEQVKCTDSIMQSLVTLSVILFVGLVSDGILQMALGSDLLRKFGGGILHNMN